MDLTLNMNNMATTVTRMAEVCEQMMQKEMRHAPYKLAAGIGLGVLITLILALLLVLEIQWIVYWSRLLRAQKQRS
jgi:acid phosphatase family membrane protein YuiD